METKLDRMALSFTKKQVKALVYIMRTMNHSLEDDTKGELMKMLDSETRPADVVDTELHIIERIHDMGWCSKCEDDDDCGWKENKDRLKELKSQLDI